MKYKALILCYDFPPYISVGALRPFGWYQRLSEFNIEPVIVTRQWNNNYGNHLDYVAPSETDKIIIEQTDKGLIIKTPFKPHLGNKLLLKYGGNKYKTLRKIITACFEFMQFLFLVGNKLPIYKAAYNYLLNNKVDVIIATGDPFVLFKYASQLSKTFNIPWVADYRDPWSQSEFKTKSIIQKSWESVFERKFNKTCIKIITVSDFLINKISEPDKNKFVIIKNGYNDIFIDSLKNIEQNKSIFSIAIAGSIYKHHPVKTFLKVCNSWIQSDKSIKFNLNFFGINIQSDIQDFINKECKYLIDKINFFPKTGNNELIYELSKQNAFLLFNAYATTGTKIYEYLALKRKIILCFVDDNEALDLYKRYYTLKIKENDNNHLQADIIKETNSGIIVKDSVELYDILTELYKEFTQNGFIACKSKNIEQFSQKIQVQKLADLIRNIKPTKERKILSKKALILAYDFPPYVSVGALRPHSWYKYLPGYDIYPVVITRQWENKYGNLLDYIAPGYSPYTEIETSENGTIIRSPYYPNLANRILLKYGENKFRGIRKAISAYYELFQHIFFIGPKSRLFFEAKKYLQNNKVDIIISTGEPYILFRYASLLSKKFKIPWLADYRDPWIQDKQRMKNIVIKKWESFFENRYINSTKTIITVSDFFKTQIARHVHNKTFHIIPNGYDAEICDIINTIPQSDKIFSIGFSGTIYNWHPIESFLKVCSRFVNEKEISDFQINFYGINIENQLNKLIHSKYNNLIPFIHIYPRLSYIDVVKELAKNNLLLLFNYFSYMGTKIFDYLAIKRQILLCYSNDREAMELKKQYYNFDEFNSENTHLQQDLILETNSGLIIKDANDLSDQLEKLYNEFKANGFIACNSHGVEQYSRREQTGKLAAVIKDVINDKSLLPDSD